MKRKDRVDLIGFLILTGCTLLWGLNYPVVKLTNTGLSPVFNSLMRSVIASVFGIGYCLYIKQPLFHKDIRLFHGFIVGLLFNLEFICVYVSLIYTDAARSVIFVNLSPFVVAIGAYIFVREKLGVWQVGGIVLAFLGAYLVLQGKPRTWTSAMLKGDLLAITAAVLWGATTVYIILDYGRESTNKSKKRVRWAAVQRQLQCRITMTDAMSVAVTPSTKTIFDLGVQRFSPTQIFRFITLSLPVGIAFYTPFMLDSQTAFFTSMFGL